MFVIGPWDPRHTYPALWYRENAGLHRKSGAFSKRSYSVLPQLTGDLVPPFKTCCIARYTVFDSIISSVSINGPPRWLTVFYVFQYVREHGVTHITRPLGKPPLHVEVAFAIQLAGTHDKLRSELASRAGSIFRPHSIRLPLAGFDSFSPMTTARPQRALSGSPR
jgi:hypothetical protein